MGDKMIWTCLVNSFGASTTIATLSRYIWAICYLMLKRLTFLAHYNVLRELPSQKNIRMYWERLWCEGKTALYLSPFFILAGRYSLVVLTAARAAALYSNPKHSHLPEAWYKPHVVMALLLRWLSLSRSTTLFLETVTITVAHLVSSELIVSSESIFWVSAF